MAKIERLSSQAERRALQRLAAFIEVAKAKNNPFGPNVEFDDDRWDVTRTTRGSGLGTRRITFTTLESTSRTSPQLLASDFRPFAKAYLIDRQDAAPSSNQQNRLSALRAVETALRSADSSFVQLRGDHLDHSARLVADRFSKDGAYRIGVELELLSEVISEHQLIQAPLQWRNPIRRPKSNVRVGKEHEERRAKRLPASGSLEAVALAFRRAVHPSDQLVAATAALLCSAPVRIGEVLRMRAICEVEDRTSRGEPAFGLRWWTEKGVEPETRWVLPEMVTTVRTALGVLESVTQDARKIAAWYERHPSKLYLPPRFAHLREASFIPLGDAEQLLGINPEGWATRKKVPLRRAQQTVGFNFNEFEVAILGDLPTGFPIVDSATGLKASDALFVVSFNEFRTDRGTSLCMFEPVTQQQIRDGLGGRVEHNFPSTFSRLGLVNPDGSPIKINTHAFRHFLNTLVQRGGADPLDIAKWSGRKSVAQNAAYDHLSADDYLEDLQAAVGSSGEALPIKVQPPISAEEFTRLTNGAAHVTEFGFCQHDFAMLPCQLHRDCLNCDEHVCIKGDAAKEERLARWLDRTRALLAKAADAAAERYEGADVWREHQERTAARAEQILSILRDPSVPLGSVIKGAGRSDPLRSDQRRALLPSDEPL